MSQQEEHIIQTLPMPLVVLDILENVEISRFLRSGETVAQFVV